MSYRKPFSRDVFEQRVYKVKQRMQAAGFDLLICQDPASMGWLTGFDGWPFYPPQGVLRRHGYSKESRVGYSIGLNYPPDWGERTASLRPGDTTELREGMCFHFQSGMWLQDYDAAVSEPFVVTATGGEQLSQVARELIITD
ncbi:MAG: hypothetical protein GY785_22190 [Gammaproteobacteria bacterium]|nr:hypothetical protein [Gammaproteobacteria bacterium]